MPLSKAQQYVVRYVAAKVEQDALEDAWNEMSADERAEATGGLDWLDVIGTPGSVKKRGRPRGSRNRAKTDEVASNGTRNDI